MSQLLTSVKSILSKNKIIPIISLLALAINMIVQFLSSVKKVLFSQISICALLIFFTYFLKKLFWEIENKTEEKYNVTRKVFSANWITVAKIGKYVVWILLLYPVYILSSFLIKINLERKTCNINNGKIGILIANFNKKSETDDGFTSALYGKLNSRLQSIDTIFVNQTNKYISEATESYIDTIKQSFNNNCSRSGLLIFGNRTSENLLNCRVYSLNFINFYNQSFKSSDNTIVYIQNPAFLDFTIDNETSSISEFVYGLLYYHSGNTMLANNSFEQALIQNKNFGNTQFMSICRLFIGNSYSQKKQYTDAIEQYRIGISADSTNSYLHYNLAIMLNEIGKITAAYIEYEVAQKLNHDLKNPLKFFTKNKKSTNDIRKLSRDLNNKNIENKPNSLPIKNWEESWSYITNGKLFGVINNQGDTIVNCRYDNIEYRKLKGADCFIIISDKKYGLVVHKHTDEGYFLHKLPLEYSQHTIYGAMETCVDGHLDMKSSEFYLAH